MDEQAASAGAENPTSIERKGDRELVVRRTFDAPPSIVYKAWSQPELFQRWWVPKSAPGVLLVSCDMDVRTGGKYRLEFGDGGSETMSFYGKYLEVVPNERFLTWMRDECAASVLGGIAAIGVGSEQLIVPEYGAIKAAFASAWPEADPKFLDANITEDLSHGPLMSDAAAALIDSDEKAGLPLLRLTHSVW